MSPVRKAFKVKDKFNNGFLGRVQVMQVLDQLDGSQKTEGDYKVELADKFPGDVMTFSELISELAQQTIETENELVSYLQFYFDKNS